MKESPILNLFINIIIPVVILTQLNNYLNPLIVFALALIFPLLYGLYYLVKLKKYNLFSLIGLISIFLTGGIGLLQLDSKWIAFKEAGVPFLIGLLLLISIKTRYSLIEKLLGQIVNGELIYEILKKKNNMILFKKKIKCYTYLISFSFFFSSLLNYLLAKTLLISEPGTIAFNQELGRMTALSFPVIALPSSIILAFIFYFLFKDIKILTGLDFEEILLK